ncbi:hypothetical protein CTAYLR_007426 [Chrysophaeum taylorii]|uniref:DUF1499 domain-containing protein n=1 Tax=Chrysophaeum taylorii TaxID=2483200 RepID=A0AAD7XEE7_9STRA|nr:hypothetical protein CTAYLR_007426 [Chrysophaeum taylorii]
MKFVFLSVASALVVTRRDLGAIALLGAAPANAIEPCKPNANNCWSTASTDKTKMAPWVFPGSKTEAIADLKAAVGAYPQQGQDGVDLGGWVEVVPLDKGYGKYEFKSGIGNFAKFFNGGQPFVDDFELELTDTNVQVRSSSRVGDSDLGVNAKRINYIAQALQAKGWDAPAIPAK